MRTEVRQFIVDTLEQMNYDVAGIDDDTTLGPAGLDLESLAIAEVAVRVEDKFGVKFGEETEDMAGMSIGEYVTAVVERLELARTQAE
jgi:acyl carrier protein